MLVTKSNLYNVSQLDGILKNVKKYQISKTVYSGFQKHQNDQSSVKLSH
jgi:hypothetical protein